jgi:hypothetical protein
MSLFDIFYAIHHFKISKIASGDAVSSVTAHSPAPMSFTLAQRRYALSSIIKKRS